jgi:hypothetical protein
MKIRQGYKIFCILFQEVSQISYVKEQNTYFLHWKTFWWVWELIHSGQHPYLCDVCNKTFSHKSHVKSRQLMHSGWHPYLCDVCKKHSFTRVAWTNSSLRIVVMVIMPVKCVINHLVKSLILSHTCLYILASVLIGVMCVRKHSVTSLMWRNISIYIVASVLMPVMCVIKHLVMIIYLS